MILTDKIPFMRGKVEFFDNNGNKFKEISNLVLMSTRVAMLYNIFKDQKILDRGISEGYLKKTKDPTKENYIPTICGFMFGNNGVNISNPSILRVPSPNDKILTTKTLDSNPTNFIPVPFLSVADSTGTLLNTAGSFNNIDEFINNPLIIPGLISSQTNKGSSINTTVKYFSPSEFEDESNYYCKAIDTVNSDFKIDNTSFEMEYIITFNVEPFDLIGKSFSELGLVLANCNISDGGIITDIDTDTVTLASRLTFSTTSLASELLAAFKLKYHVYF